MATPKQVVNNNTTDFIIIDGYLLDVALSEEHTFEADVTSYPVESGTTISDLYRIKPISVTIEGLVSNVPFGPIVNNRVALSNNADDAYRVLLDIRNQREPVTITTSLDTYKNMALTSLSIPRGGGEADFLKFTAKFEEIQIVTVDKAKPASPTARPPQNKTKPTKKVGDVFRVLNIGNNTNGSFIWLDDNIGGWRHGGALTAGGWVFLRGVPFGYSDSLYRSTHPTDPALKAFIANAKKSKGVFTSSATNQSNPFDPFDKRNAVSSGQVFTAKDAFTVNGFIVSSALYQELTSLSSEGFGF